MLEKCCEEVVIGEESSMANLVRQAANGILRTIIASSGFVYGW